MSILKVKSRIYVDTELMGANVSCVDTEQGLVLIDTAYLPHEIQQWKEALAKLGNREIACVINTDYHFDHCTGNALLSPNVVAHQLTYEEMAKPDGTMRHYFLPGMEDLSPEVMVWLGARLSDRHSLSAAVLDRYALHVFEAGSSERLCGFLVYPSLFEFKYEQGEIPRDDSIKSAELRRRVQALRETTYQHLLLKTKTIREYMAFVTALRAAQKATHVGDWKQREEEMVEQLLRKRVTDVQELIEMYVFVRSDEQAAERVRKRILKHESVQLSSMEVLIESARNEVLFPKLTFKLRLMAEVQPGEMLLHPDGDDALVMSLLRVARKQKSRASTWRRWCREMEKLWQEEEGRALLMSRVFRLALEAADTDQKCVQLYDACPVWFEMLQDDTTKQSETALFKLQLADQELYLEKVFGLTDTVEEAENCYSHLSWHSGALRKKMEKEMVRRAKALLEEVD